MTASAARRRIIAGTSSAVLVAGVALAAGYALTARPQTAASTDQVPTATAAVTRGAVSQRLRLLGTYGFDGTYPIVHQGSPGILTGAAAPGATIRRGAALYSVDGQPVRLLLGTMPAYRDLRSGMTAGQDVRQLEQNLVAMGLDPRRRIVVDARFTPATAAAIRRWQASWGVPASQRTGALALGQVIFAPVPLRVRAASVVPGTAVGPNQPVLTATSTARVVTAQVTADRQASVEVGGEVMVTLPGSAPAPGTVLRTSRVAEAPEEADGRPPGPATIAVAIRVTAPTGVPDLDQASVQVSIAAAEHRDVLLVPVAALLARPGGGYRVRRAGGAYVQVEPGLFDEATGNVEVSGDLTEGDRVEVPVP